MALTKENKPINGTGIKQLWNKIKSSFSKIGHLGDNADFNNVIDGGMYRYDTNPSNGPSGGGEHGQLLVVRGTGDTIAQLCFPYADLRMFLRTGNAAGNPSGNWNGWVAIANNAPNGFNPDNFNDGSTWLNHTSSQNEVGNSNRPLVLYGTQIKNNSGQIMATEDDLTWNSISGKPSSFTPSSHTHTKSQITDFPTIPTVNNPTITITQGGVSKGSFTLNQSGNKTITLDGANVVELTRVWSGNSTTASFSVDYNSVYIIVFDYMTAIIKTVGSGLGVIGYSNLISYIDSNSLIAGRGIYLAQIEAYTSKITSTFRLYSQMHSSSITNSTSSTGTYHYIKEVYKITM